MLRFFTAVNMVIFRRKVVIVSYFAVPTIYVLEQKYEKMYTLVNTSFTVSKWGARGYKLHRHVIMIFFLLYKL